MFKVLSYRKLQSLGQGAFGQYFKIKGKKRGVKLMRDRWWNTEEDAKLAFKGDFENEFKALKKLRKRTNLVPTPHHPVIVKQRIGDSFVYRVGYMMTHIEGHTLTDYSEISSEGYYKAEEKFKKAIGLHYLSDNHYGNIMITKTGEYVFIDAGRFI